MPRCLRQWAGSKVTEDVSARVKGRTQNEVYVRKGQQIERIGWTERDGPWSTDKNFWEGAYRYVLYLPLILAGG